ncbi:MAG: carboxypeptidase-like regulatory domain-containing protein [Acidobacteriota bacterium]
MGKTKRHKSVIAAVVIVCVLLWAGWLNFFYVDGVYQGKIQDLESGRPIEGAVIMVMWTRVSLGAHPVETYHDVQETLSDSEGNFTLPGTWGLTFPLVTGVKEPVFVIFRPHYAAFRGSWDARLSPAGPIQRSQQNKGMLFELGRLTVREERVDNMGKLFLHLCDQERTFPDCIPRDRVPHLIRLEDAEYNELWAQ